MGRALNSVLNDQFVTQRGLRPVSHGFPRILIVMTDGMANDEVATPAAFVRANNIVVYAIGIGNYNSNQLHAVASSSEHVHLLDTFSGLTDFAATLTASTCFEPQPISIGTVIDGRVQKDEFQYYKYFVPKISNLQVVVTDTEGSTLLYASRENPHPYEYDSDLGFLSASLRLKILVISPVLRNDDIEKRQLSTTDGNSTHQAVYISVLGATNDVSYTLTGSMCDPAECSEGTNKANILQATTVNTVLIMAVAIVMNFFGL